MEDGVVVNKLAIAAPEMDFDKNDRRSALVGLLLRSVLTRVVLGELDTEYATADPTNKPDASKTEYLRFILDLLQRLLSYLLTDAR